MAKPSCVLSFFFLVTIAFGYVTSARILDELIILPSNPTINAPEVLAPATTLPSARIPATATTGSAPEIDDIEPAADRPVIPEPEAPAATAAPEADIIHVAEPIVPPAEPPQAKDRDEQPAATLVEQPVAGAATEAEEAYVWDSTYSKTSTNLS